MLALDAQVAQLVEQWTENPRVGGSNPPLGTTFFPELYNGEGLRRLANPIYAVNLFICLLLVKVTQK